MDVPYSTGTGNFLIRYTNSQQSQKGAEDRPAK